MNGQGYLTAHIFMAVTHSIIYHKFDESVMFAAISGSHMMKNWYMYMRQHAWDEIGRDVGWVVGRDVGWVVGRDVGWVVGRGFQLSRSAKSPRIKPSHYDTCSKAHSHAVNWSVNVWPLVAPLIIQSRLGACKWRRRCEALWSDTWECVTQWHSLCIVHDTPFPFHTRQSFNYQCCNITWCLCFDWGLYFVIRMSR